MRLFIATAQLIIRNTSKVSRDKFPYAHSVSAWKGKMTSKMKRMGRVGGEKKPIFAGCRCLQRPVRRYTWRRVFRGKSEVDVISDWTARVSLAGAGAVHRGVGSIIWY